MTEREEFSHALTIEIVRDIAKERGITLPILVDASGIRTFMITAYNEGFAAATTKADARIKELEKELSKFSELICVYREAFEKMHEMSKGYSTTFYAITREALSAIAKHKKEGSE